MIAKIGTLIETLIVAIAFLLLALRCISSNSVEISASLNGAVTGSLQGAGLSGVKSQADGRDITLTGVAPTGYFRAKAESLAWAPGVRSVANHLVVGGDAKAVQLELDKILLEKKIEFATGQSVILPVSTPVLREVHAVLTKAPQLSLFINGHTDNAGDAAANRALSEARAQAVVAWLTRNGIAGARMKAAGFGPDKPLATNDTPDGRAKNRRVEIIAN